MATTKKASVHGARRVVANLDQIADLFQTNHEALGIPAKVAMDFALRCDMLSDSIQGQYKNASFDASTIGEEVKGPLVNDSTQGYMAGHFTQERFDALEAKVDGGTLTTNAEKHVADPKLASLLDAVAKKAATEAVKLVTASFSRKAEEEAPAKEEKKEDAEAKEEATEAKEEEEAKTAASLFGLFASK